jgi:hypothetical protein
MRTCTSVKTHDDNFTVRVNTFSKQADGAGMVVGVRCFLYTYGG